MTFGDAYNMLRGRLKFGDPEQIYAVRVLQVNEATHRKCHWCEDYGDVDPDFPPRVLPEDAHLIGELRAAHSQLPEGSPCK